MELHARHFDLYSQRRTFRQQQLSGPYFRPMTVSGNATGFTNQLRQLAAAVSRTPATTAPSHPMTVSTQGQTADHEPLTFLPSSSVNAGATVTLTATVVHGRRGISGSRRPSADANAAQCTGDAIFGTAQLTSPGTATLKVVLGAGSYSIKAVFADTTPYQKSESSPQALTVNGVGGYTTTTTIAATGSVNNYTLTGTVTAFGKPIPTGTISFLDTTTSNSVPATADLDPLSLGFTMTPATASSAVDGSPYLAVTGDIDNDGKFDLAIPTGSASTISVLLGNGDGTFMPQVTYATNPDGQAYAIATGDFNGDGNPDLAVTQCGHRRSAHGLQYRFGKWRWEHSNRYVAYTVGNFPSAVVVGDFNGDGDADLAVANRDDNTVGVLLGERRTGNSPDASAIYRRHFSRGCNNSRFQRRRQHRPSYGKPQRQYGERVAGYGDGTFNTQLTYAVGNSPCVDGGPFQRRWQHRTRPQQTAAILPWLVRRRNISIADNCRGRKLRPDLSAASYFNGDGKVDLTSPNSVTGTVNALSATQTGHFRRAHYFLSVLAPPG